MCVKTMFYGKLIGWNSKRTHFDNIDWIDLDQIFNGDLSNRLN